MKNRVSHLGIVILAGGQSSRLGSPKQLLEYRGSTLLEHAVQVAIDAALGPVVVVTGAKTDAVQDVLKGNSLIETVENQDWEEGMASSLRAGLRQMTLSHRQTNGIIFMVCDQPFVTKSILLCLREIQETTGKAIAACSYQGKPGTPALFHQTFFGELLNLRGDKGARMLIASHPEELAIVPFEEGAIDIDTREDYERLINRQNERHDC